MSDTASMTSATIPLACESQVKDGLDFQEEKRVVWGKWYMVSSITMANFV